MGDSSICQEIPNFCNEANNQEKKVAKEEEEEERWETNDFFQERNNLEQNIVICATGW